MVLQPTLSPLPLKLIKKRPGTEPYIIVRSIICSLTNLVRFDNSVYSKTYFRGKRDIHTSIHNVQNFKKHIGDTSKAQLIAFKVGKTINTQEAKTQQVLPN